MTPRGTYPAPHSSVQRNGSASGLLILFSLIWVLTVVGVTVAAWLFLVFVAIGSSIGANNGSNRVPQLLLHPLPFVSVLLLGGGLWLIHRLCRPKPPQDSFGVS